MLEGDELEPQSWLRCPLTCVGQDATPNSNLAGAILILYLIKPAHCMGFNEVFNELKPTVSDFRE